MLSFNTSVFFKYHTCSLMMTRGLLKWEVNFPLDSPSRSQKRERTCKIKRNPHTCLVTDGSCVTPVLMNSFYPFAHLYIHPFMPPPRPPASLYHVQHWVIGSGSSHYGVPVECSSPGPLMRRLLFSSSQWTDRSSSPCEHLSQLIWRGSHACRAHILITVPLLNQHS